MKKALLLFLACLFVFASCSRGYVYRFLNNSGQDLVVISYDTALVPKEYPIEKGASRDVRFPTKLVIRHAMGEWNYSLRAYTGGYEYTRKAGFRVQDVQVEPNGAIYLLPPRTKHAVQQFPHQPEGLPLIPR